MIEITKDRNLIDLTDKDIDLVEVNESGYRQTMTKREALKFARKILNKVFE